MPELPEVETIKNELAQNITGRRIISITINDARPIQGSIQAFSDELMHQKIASVSRRGKYILFKLSSGKILAVHLRMTGSLLINPHQLDKYARVIFELDSHDLLVFRDLRRFGTMQIISSPEVIEKKLGIEPFDPSFTPELLKKLLSNRNVPIKALLLDQGFIAGLGNMYADEALFTARVHPLKKAADLNSSEVKRLHGAILTVLESAIKSGGASVANYMRTDGTEGNAHNEFNVAHRAGERCYICGSPLRRIVVRQRGTYFCPKCQKM